MCALPSRRRAGAHVLLGGLILLPASFALGGVVLDGSMGTSGALTGPTYTIPASDGKQVGGNLFHSFSAFDLQSSETAMFTTAGSSGSVNNIIARVTGGNASSIDGTINTTQFFGANFFLINPSGVIIGPDAHFSVAGSMVVSSASYVKMSDGGKFNSSLGGDDNLTSAPVSAFGFLGAPGAISVNGTHIFASPGTEINLIGGNLTLSSAFLFSSAGYINMLSVASAGEAPFNATAPVPVSRSAFSSYGTVTMNQGTQATISGQGGGQVVIRGGQIVMDNSTVTAPNFGATTGGSIEIDAVQLNLSDGATISTQCYGSATGGAIAVNLTGDLSVDGDTTSISAITNAASTADGGAITVQAANLSLTNGGSIFTNTSDGESAGDVTCNLTGNLDVNGLLSQVSSTTTVGSTGDGGVVSITAASLTLEQGGTVQASTSGGGSAGNVDITAPDITLNDTSQIAASSLFATGNAGQVNITAVDLTLNGQSSIVAESLGSQGVNSGAAGGISIQAVQLTVNEQSLISVNTLLGTGQGGDIAITAQGVNLNGSGPVDPPTYGITAQSISSSGDAGSISVAVAGNLSITGGDTISSSSYGTGAGGDTSVSFQQGQLSGGSTISAKSVLTNAGQVSVTGESLTLSGGSLLDTSAALNGGNVNVNLASVFYLLQSSITAYAGVFNNNVQNLGGSGGNISIAAAQLVLNQSLISANDLAPLGSDGNIINTSPLFLTSNSILHATGTIITTPPDLDLGNSLQPIPADPIDKNKQMRERCAAAVNHEFSTMIMVGRGGIEPTPEELQADLGPSVIK